MKKKVAKKVGKGRPTKYRKEYCDQAAQLCALGAKDNLDSKVERSLFERAMGFAHTDTKEFMKHYAPA